MTTPSTPSTPGTPTTLLVSAERAAELKAASQDWPSWDLDEDQVCDLELLSGGAYAPLAGFMTAEELAAVEADHRLPDGTPWPTPVTLEVDADTSAELADGARLALRDAEGTMLAVLTVTSRSVRSDAVALGGPVEALQLPNHYDFTDLRRTAAEVSADGADHVAVATRRPLLDDDIARLRDAVVADGAPVLILSMVGPAVPGLLEPHALVRSHVAALADLPEGSEVVIVPVAAGRTADAEAALMEVVARNHAAEPVAIDPSHPDIDAAIHDGRPLPDGLASAAVLEEVRRAAPPRHERGFTVFFTGLSGSGKSTVANVLNARLLEVSRRPVTLLDGDLVRKNLSSELGFSKEHRDLNVLRIGYVASEITKHRGIAVCCPIAPYDDVRRQNRATIEATGGGYVLVHISTPLAECEARDRKGLYAKARAGLITGMTGIDDPYEVPEDADLSIDTTNISPSEAAEQVLAHLVDEGWLSSR